MPNPSQRLVRPGRVEAAADAVTTLACWDRRAGNIWCLLFGDALRELQGLGFSPAEVEAAFRRLQQRRYLAPMNYEQRHDRDTGEVREFIVSFRGTDRLLDLVDKQELHDGPISGNRFRYGGRVADLTPLQFSLAEYLWGREAATIADVQDAVWEGKLVSDGAVRSMVSRLNERFAGAGMPVSVEQKAGRLALHFSG